MCGAPCDQGQCMQSWCSLWLAPSMCDTAAFYSFESLWRRPVSLSNFFTEDALTNKLAMRLMSMSRMQ